jgi:hypothetical protein
MAFDEEGSIFVAEMRGYPNDVVATGDISSGRIKQKLAAKQATLLCGKPAGVGARGPPRFATGGVRAWTILRHRPARVTCSHNCEQVNKSPRSQAQAVSSAGVAPPE